jgi:rhomboid protease GluP
MARVDHRRMCPHCRAFISSGDRICPYCETEVGPRAADLRRASGLLEGLTPHGRFLTVLILTINAGLYAATILYGVRTGEGDMMSLSGRTLYHFGAKFTPAVLGGEWWRLVTAGFLHGGLFHFLMNSWVLLDLGAQVEEIYGAKRFIVIYFMATVAGFMASVWWTPALSVGASAGIFGLIGAMIALGVRSRTLVGAAIRGWYIRWAVYGFLLGLLPFFRIDNAAHVGGLAGGFAAAYVLRLPGEWGPLGERVWSVAAALAVVLTAVAFLLMFLRFAQGA